MPIKGNDRATTPSRANVAVAGQTRCGWVPHDVKPDGTYIWDNLEGMESQGPDTSWTEVTT